MRTLTSRTEPIEAVAIGSFRHALLLALPGRISIKQSVSRRRRVLSVLLVACIWGMCPAMHGQVVDRPGESNLRHQGGQVVLHTDDGLAVTLESATGRVVGLAIGTSIAKPEAVPLLRIEEVVETEGAPDLLGASSPAAWGMPDAAAVTDANGFEGHWLRVQGMDTARPRRSVQLDQDVPKPLILSGWCQAKLPQEALGWWNRHLALNAVAHYTDGKAMPELSAHFGQYDHGPQLNRRVICPDRPIATVDVNLSMLSEGTAWYRDVTLRQAEFRRPVVQAPLEHLDWCLRQQINLPEEDLRAWVTYHPQPDRVEIRCELESTAPRDRAVSLYLAFPLDARGGLWHDHARRARQIADGELYRHGFRYGAGRDGHQNRYPFAAVQTATGAGLALGTSVFEPRVFQTEYDAGSRELRIRFDVGLSPAAGRWANRAAVSAVLFTYDARDGFRAAMDRYHGLYPEGFRRRGTQHGTWLAFISPEAVTGDSDDFGFRFIEAVCMMGANEKKGLYSLRYAEPWILHQYFPPHVPMPEVQGDPLPGAALKVARKIATWSGQPLPYDVRQRYPAFLGSYITDKWGVPDGYLFRKPGGRNENMMIVNPNARLPPPPGAAYSSGAWDMETIREVSRVRKQWDLPGWTFARTSSHPFLEVDDESAFSGTRSVRLLPVQGKSYFEQYLRGLSQVQPYTGAPPRELRFSCAARAIDVPEKGTACFWVVTCVLRNGKRVEHRVALPKLTTNWQTFSATLAVEGTPLSVQVSLTSPTWTPDPTTLWIDAVHLTDANGRDLLHNGGFETAELLPCELDGVYLDTLECYEGDLNYRREHWPYADEPLTFDCGRAPALHQLYSHVTFARQTAQRMRPLGKMVFANCSPSTCFAAPYADAMGSEVHWKHGKTWAPWNDEQFAFVRFMCAQKPFCLLQYSDLDPQEQARYMRRCLFFGVSASNQASPRGGWYWTDPAAVERHRPVFARYAALTAEVGNAGWHPLTYATVEPSDCWIERFGEGEAIYLTVFNPGAENRHVTVALDKRAGVSRAWQATRMLQGQTLSWRGPGLSLQFLLGPEDVAVVRIERHPVRPLAP